MKFTYPLPKIEEAAEKIIASAKTQILLFTGGMGAGKTTLIREIVKKLGSNDIASSPTFSLVNEYDIPSGPVFHFDFYRIESQEEALDIGFEDYLMRDAWIFVEWPEKVEGLLPQDCTRIFLEVLSNVERKLSLEN